jgi:hypothetical protein
VVGGQALGLVQGHEGALQEGLVLILERQRKAIYDAAQDLQKLCRGAGKGRW